MAERPSNQGVEEKLPQVRKVLNDLQEGGILLVTGEVQRQRGGKAREGLPKDEMVELFVAPAYPVDTVDKLNGFVDSLGGSIKEIDSPLKINSYHQDKRTLIRGVVGISETIASKEIMTETVTKKITTTTMKSLENGMEPQISSDEDTKVKKDKDSQFSMRTIFINVYPDEESARLAYQYENGDIKKGDLRKRFGKGKRIFGSFMERNFNHRSTQIVKLPR